MVTRQFSTIAVKVAAVPVGLFIAIAYLKLGYFIVFLLPLGAALTVWLTLKQRGSYAVAPFVVFIVLAYSVVTVVLWRAAIQTTEEDWQLTWELGERADATNSEIRLGLGGGHYLLSYSTELHEYLEDQGRSTVDATLPITRVLGCFQSVGPVHIQGWGTAPSGGYLVAGGGSGPWPEHWWCP